MASHSKEPTTPAHHTEPIVIAATDPPTRVIVGQPLGSAAVDVPAAHPTFVVASASAAAIPIAEPLGDETIRKLQSKGTIAAVEKARRDAGLA